MNLLRVLRPSRDPKPGIDGGGDGEMDPSARQRRRRPRLDRRNAAKDINYAAAEDDASSDGSSRGGGALRIRSLDLPPSSASSSYHHHHAGGQTSFRIDGSIEGEVDILYHSLGLSGPEDFAIPAADWEARKVRCSTDVVPMAQKNLIDPDEEPQQEQDHQEELLLLDRSRVSAEVSGDADGDGEPKPLLNRPQISIGSSSMGAVTGSGGGIRGVRPPFLAPPPSISLPVFTDKICPPFLALAPEESKPVELNEEDRGVRLGVTSTDLTGSCSYSTSNDDDSSSTTTEGNYISPNGRVKRHIGSWMRGRLLGSGSFGTVYEAINDDGFFFAVKEVSLLDHGGNARSVNQLEQEIALLSQFEHENIVQYLGTQKEEGKLNIFIELVSQGSLASLYQKYNLQDSQVSAYTRQILNGLRYLHDRNVVHRDIKCANILVDASGSVKLADFGLAKEATNLNLLKSCQGSVYWMAPEVVNPQRTYGPAADIWSLGCTVLEMLTRQLPFPNLEWASALFRIGRGEQPPIPSSLSRDARDFILQCVQVDPDDRPSASKLLDHPFVKRPLPSASGSDSSSHGVDRRSWLQSPSTSTDNRF